MEKEEKDPKTGSRIEIYQKIVETHGFHGPIGRLLGYKLVEIKKGRAKLVMNVKPETMNSNGVLQGGALASLADAAMGLAFGSLLLMYQNFTTIEFKLNFIRPITSGTLTSVGEVVHFGKTTGVSECQVFDENQRLVATGVATMIILK